MKTSGGTITRVYPQRKGSEKSVGNDADVINSAWIDTVRNLFSDEKIYEIVRTYLLFRILSIHFRSVLVQGVKDGKVRKMLSLQEEVSDKKGSTSQILSLSCMQEL
jgi:hypothetical protein